MSSDGYFDDELDAAALDELDVIESTQFAPAPPRRPSPPRAPSRPSRPLAKEDSDLFDVDFDVDETELQKLDQAIQVTYQSQAPSTKPSSRAKLTRVPSKGGRQMTLFGGVLPEASMSRKPPSTTANRGEGSSRTGMQRTKSSGEVFRKTKKWDQTAFAKSGPRRSKSKKGKEKADPNDEGEEEGVEFEQFPAPFVSGPPPPMKLQPDLLAARRWIFPLNRPKREYQFNISKHCLFDNTLVALPTGLGKTFIAGVVMLNFYRWFPGGKVVFVAPTKPLVAQQIEACHKTCGIPGRDAAELTGSVAKAKRNRLWQEKRVFYMTPQTLEHDLMSENCDVGEIVLLVVDEAHKGTGDYSYAKVVRFLMAKNPHFRVLALTATPGGNPEAVQSIIDSLHISRIEIRNEESLDIRGYINKKKIEQHIITMNDDIVKLRDLLSKIMIGHVRRLAKDGILRGNLDPVYMHPFRLQAAMGEIRNRPDAARLSWAYPVLKKVGTLARAMGYLLEASPQMCYGCLKEAADDSGGSEGKSSASKLTNDPVFRELMRELESQRLQGFAIHPKMETLKRIVIDHFGKRMEDTDVQEVNGDGTNRDHAGQTRVMVFVSFREAVDEIVAFLNQESPLLRATKFIGQGTDKQGKKGFAQSEQLKVIEQFKQGDFNILVSTSIGEEGLDIGEIDMIVCYESQKTPIRMLQRVGRTGRKRDGYVHVLLAEGREELNWTKAQESYSEVQQSIVKGDQLEFYGDVERLLPDHVKPECLEMVMEIEEYDREATEKARRAQSPRRGATKRKRDDDVGRNIPAGASTGFVSVADLILKQGGKKRKKMTEIDLELAGEDDDTDEEIQAGLFGPRRTVSAAAASGSRSRKPKERRTTSMVDGGTKKKKARKKSAPASYTFSQLAAAAADDSDDLEIERGIVITKPRSPEDSAHPASRSSSPDVPLVKTHTSMHVDLSSSPEIPIASASRSARGFPSIRSSSPDIPLAGHGSVIDICTPSTSSPSSPRRLPSSSLERPLHKKHAGSRSIASPKQPTPPSRSQSSGSAIHPKSSSAPKDDEDLSWLLAESDDGDARSSPVRLLSPVPVLESVPDGLDVEIVEDKASGLLNTTIELTSSPGPAGMIQPLASKRATRDMPPPAIPFRIGHPVPAITPVEDAPEPSFMVRAIGKAKKRAVDIPDTDSSPFDPPPLKRLRRPQESSSPAPAPVKKKKLKIKDTAEARKRNPWIDVEASHSGNEYSEGSSEADRLDGEGDRSFLHDSPATQASTSYDQSAVYRQSLLTQAPFGAGGPVFAERPLRRTLLGNRPRAQTPSSPREDDVQDEYILGSFIVDDEADISYMHSSET
ncbi:P-loop containing nucleoside triphosphate hydrolase protein [Dentipellis sp. KUC8613]|nr:P-loop containing nucleoside triphosphate hydrolase protein [Dentipellis sp. KUC8613]